MTWSKAWTASEPVTDNASYNRMMREFLTTALVGRGWTVQEPPTDNDADNTANTYFLTKEYKLFGGRTETHYSILHTEANTDDTVFTYWDGDQAGIADGWSPPGSAFWWSGSDFDPSYINASGSFYGTWEMWISDEDTDSYVVFGGITGARKLIGWGEPAGTRYAGAATYEHWPIGHISSAGPSIVSLGSSTEYRMRCSLNPYVTFMETGSGPFLTNYPTLHGFYSSQARPWGRIPTTDWLELSTVTPVTLNWNISATTYNGDNYIKIGGDFSWVLNTGATVPVL